MSSTKLPEAVKLFITERNACFDPPSMVAAAVKEEFGLDVSRQLIECYDPTKQNGANLSDRFRVRFEATRKVFIEDTAAFGISHRSWRLRTLERLALKAEQEGDLDLAMSALERAAKECGDAYTNRSRVALAVTEDAAVAARREELLRDYAERRAKAEAARLDA
jgi:hypothetical protein